MRGRELQAELLRICRRRRMQLGAQPADIDRALGWRAGGMTNLEQGIGRLSFDELLALLDILGLSADEVAALLDAQHDRSR